jgi:putative transposase
MLPKKKDWRYNSFFYPQSGFQLKEDKLLLSKIGPLKMKLHRSIEGNIKTVTIRRTSTNKWFMWKPKILNKIRGKLSQIQRWHSRKKLKSKNRSKSRLRIAKIHERIKDQRLDFL